MKYKWTNTHLILALLFCYSLASGQSLVWPGDVNNNGVVSASDLLHLGKAYGTTGSERTNGTADWFGQPVSEDWSGAFPAGGTYAFADADGDGEVGESDLIGGILGNFGKSHGTAFPEGYLNGTQNTDPSLTLSAITTSANPGSTVQIGLELGDALFPISNFYGISFLVSFNNNDFVDLEQGVTFNVADSAWIDPSGTNHRKIAMPQGDGKVQFAFTRLDQTPIQDGSGSFGSFFIIIEDIVNLSTLDTLEITIDSIKLVDENLNVLPIATSQTAVALSNTSPFNPGAGGCPNIVDPVCGANGITYLNSCYALQAGVTVFSSGVCYNDCIDPTQIGEEWLCPTVYIPVCGCNDVTYINECKAEVAGITSYTSGPCPTNNCHDFTQIAVNGSVNIDPSTGVITVNCGNTYDPVCGCDGITYQNSCWAEASGITSYTQGECGSCVEPWAINPDTICTYVYEPVCGCNGETYINECHAYAAGVLDFIAGTCSASTWCNEATPIQCGDFLPNETNIGAGNQISQYTGCLNTTLVGPDKVYVVNKTTPGDLQIGLEIITPGLDLDLFLLDGDCNAVNCLASSHTNNSQTNNEGILYENAPIGTYYIVVDGQFANSQGNFRLEVSCAYLDCSEAQPLTCGEPYANNNINGNDNVSLYKCGNVLNVENNGPEMVHTFVLTEAGQVSIAMTGLSANLELFLLDACDNGNCLKYSQNGGNSNEFINAFLGAGMYYIVVDGYNGATSEYNLTVECNSGCDLELWASATDAECGSNTGSISLSVGNGSAPYIIKWWGPSSGNIATYQPSAIIPSLPAGTYQIQVTDVNGCAVNQSLTVGDGGNLNFWADPIGGSCSQSGGIQVEISSGNPGYWIYLTGAVSQNVFVNNNLYTFNNLPNGTYTVYVQDSDGCSNSQTVTLTQGNGLNFTMTPTAATCGQLGYITTSVQNGLAPFFISVEGPVNGTGVANFSNFSIQNLPGGTYTVTVEDSNWCQSTQQITVPNFLLDISATVQNGVCGQNGSLTVSVNSGTPDYTISYTNGTISNTITTSLNSTIFPNLPSGTYTINVTDGDGCTDYQVVTINNSAPSLDVQTSTSTASCNEPGSIWMNMNNGAPPFNITWSGPVSGSDNTSNFFYDITPLPGGYYTVIVTDANGCTFNSSIYVPGGGINFTATPGSANCGQNGDVDVNITNGNPPFYINWSGPVTGWVSVSNNNYNIPNLPSGTYTILVSDADGCNSSETITLNTTNTLNITATANNGNCGQNGTVSVNINGGNGNYSVTWSGPTFGSFNTTGNSLIIPNLPSGSYVVNVMDTNGCGATQSVTLTNGGGTGLSVGYDPIEGGCNENGAIIVTVQNGNSPFTINWSGPSSGNATTPNIAYTIPNLSSGMYFITVTDNTGCQDTQGLWLTNGNTLGMTATANAGICNQLGSINVNINGGTAPYAVSFDGPIDGLVNSFNPNVTLNNLPTGSYLVTAIDADGCTSADEIWLNNGGNVDFWATANNGGCGATGSIDVEIATGTAPYAIAWSGLNSGSIITSNSLYTIPNLPSDIYNVQIIDANGCSETKQVTVSNGGGNLGTWLTANPGSCGQNGSLIVEISGGTSPYTVNYSGPTSGTTTVNGNTGNIFNLPAGTYTIDITDSNGCSISESVSITNGNNFSFTATPDGGLCGQLGSIDLNFNGGNGLYSISWTGASSGSSSTFNNNYSIDNLIEGSYTITVSTGGCTDTETVWLSNGTAPSFNVFPNAGSCGSLGSITVSFGNSAAYSISWSGPISGNSTINGNSYLIENLPAGSYTITVANASGCIDTQGVWLSNSSNISVNAAANNGSCGSLGSISGSISGGVGPYTITWSGTSNGSTTSGNTNFTIPNLVTGIYTVNIVDSNNCSDTEQVTINNSGGNISTWLTANPGSCGQNGSLIVEITGGTAPYTVNYSGPTSGTTTVNGNTGNIFNLPSGTYIINITDANGCSISETITITNGSNNFNLSATGTNGNCGQPGNINLNFNGGNAPYSISWTGPVNGNNSTSNNSYNIPNLPAGSYTIDVTDGSGCTDSETVWISSTGNIIVSVTANNGTCGQNGNIDVSILGGTGGPYQITWSGASNGTISVNTNSYNIPNLPVGNYTISVTDNNGCTDSQSIWVSTGNNLSFTTNPLNGSCGALGSISLNINNGTAPYSINWTGAATGNNTSNNPTFNISNLITGNYTITVTDAAGCTSSQSVWLENGTNLTFSATPVNGGCGQNGSMNISIANGSAPFSISWTGTASGTTTIFNNSTNIPNLPAGTYTFSVLDNAGCSNSTSVTVTGSSAPSVTISSTGLLCNGLNNGSATANPTGGIAPYSYNWSNGATTQTISNLGTGTYTVTITDSANCTASANTTITQSGTITVDIASSNVVCYGDNNGSILVTGWGGTPLYTYEWSTGLVETETTPNGGSLLNNLSPGTYTITVTDANGCQAIASETITEPMPIGINVFSTDADCGQNNGTATVSANGGTPPYTYLWSTGGTTSTIGGLGAGTYTVQVFDANFCVETGQVTVGSSGNMPTAGFTYTTNGLTVNFTDTSTGGGTISYDFGNGSFSNSNNPTQTFCSEGSYTICQTITNSCGTDTYCETISLTIPSNFVTLQIGNVSGSAGSTIQVPVFIENTGMLVSVAGSFQLLNPSVGTITNVLQGEIHPTFNSTLNTFSFFDASGNGIPVNAGDVLFIIEVQLTGGVGTSSGITITDFPLPIEVGMIVNNQTQVVSHAIICGNINIPTMANAAGWVHTWWDEGIKDVEVSMVDIDNTSNDLYTTDDTGEFHFNDMSFGETYIIEPTKDTVHDNGLSTFALFVGQQYILGKNPPQIVSPYQVIAGDANCNGGFTTVDLFLIQQVLIGTSPAFSSCPSWVFMPESFTMPDPWTNTNIFPFPQTDTIQLMSDTVANFVGVKVGDILGQANPNNLTGADDRSNADLVLVTSNRSAVAGEVVKLSLTAREFSHIASMQFALNYDSKQLQLISFEEANLLSPATGLFDDQVRMSWYTGDANGLTLSENESLFKLQFNALNNIADLSELFDFEQHTFRSMAHQPDGNDYNLVLEFVNEEIIENGFDLFQNTPNPFSETTQIQFELPETMPAEIFIQDSRGKVIRQISGNFEKGLNSILIEKENIVSGVYYYTLKSGEFVKTKRMVVL